MAKIRSEYWIENGSLENADNDGDISHEGIAILHVLHQFIHNIQSLAEEYDVDPEFSMDEPDQEQVANCLHEIWEKVSMEGKEDPDEFIMRNIEAGKEAYAILTDGRGSDPHMYVMKYEGWIAVRSMNIELYKYDEQKRKSLLHGLNEIFEQEGFEEEELSDPADIDFWMEDHFNKKTTPITLADIENPQIQAKPSVPIQSTGHSKFSGVNHQDNPENQESNPAKKSKPKRRDINQAAQGAGIIQPGASLWRPTSEANMNFKEWLKLHEMPITNFNLVGQWSPDAKRNYGYSKQDIGILGSEKAVEKIHKKWSNTRFDFDFYFIRSPKAYKYQEVGKVSQQWVKDNLGIDITPIDDHITILFTNNQGAEKIPMTAWTIAHRLGHAIRREKIFEEYVNAPMDKKFLNILKNVYGVNKSDSYSYGGYRNYISTSAYEGELKAFANAIGTMNSARSRNLRNYNEFHFEVVAQWIITGNIKFNPLPRKILFKNTKAWGRDNPQYLWARVKDEEFQEYNEELQNFTDELEYNIDSIFGSILNDIFVM